MEDIKSSGLAEAIQAIQETARRSITPSTQPVKCDDGDGGTIDVPIAFLQDGAGGVSADILVDEIRKGADLARELRLRAADGPDRREGTAQHQSLASFIAHANRFKSAASAVWANAAQRTLVSVLDYHPEGAGSPAAWGRHKGTCQCPLSDGWLAWGGGKELKLDQDAFAALLDSRDQELTGGELYSGKAPDPAALITLANNLEVYSTATAKRERDPNTGRVKISFTEDKGVNGTVMPPAAFLIHIPIFQDTETVNLEVRLKVSVADGHAVFGVQIHAAGHVLRDAFDELREQVAKDTGLPVFVGTPE